MTAFFIDLALKGENDPDHEDKLKRLETAGHPVVRIVQNSPAHIVQEFFRFRNCHRDRWGTTWHQSVRSARCRSEQDQNARADECLRSVR